MLRIFHIWTFHCILSSSFFYFLRVWSSSHCQWTLLFWQSSEWMQSAVWMVFNAGDNGSQNNVDIKSSEKLSNLPKLTRLISSGLNKLISWALNPDLIDSLITSASQWILSHVKVVEAFESPQGKPLLSSSYCGGWWKAPSSICTLLFFAVLWMKRDTDFRSSWVGSRLLYKRGWVLGRIIKP